MENLKEQFIHSEGTAKYEPIYWRVRHKNTFLRAVMKELAGSAHISFEGDLSRCRLSKISGATITPTAILKRAAILPSEQDFVIVPLEPSTEHAIMSALGGTIPRSVFHIVIEKRGRLAFAAYDNFHPDCTFFGDEVSPKFVEAMITQGPLRRTDDSATLRALVADWLPFSHQPK